MGNLAQGGSPRAQRFSREPQASVPRTIAPLRVAAKQVLNKSLGIELVICRWSLWVYTGVMAASLEDILQSHRARRAIVMGILNVTPDSFSDGGRFFEPGAAIEQASRMASEGADVIDIGAESTRPGSERISAAEQIDRLQAVLPAVTRTGALVSIDTTRAGVARWAMEHGEAIINDISAGRDDAAMLPLAGEARCPIVLMHMLGQPATMQQDPQYADVVGEVVAFLSARVEAATAAGVERSRVIVDPGIGFGKKLPHNLALLGATDRLAAMGHPVLIGPSRKRFIAELSGDRRVPADARRGESAQESAAEAAKSSQPIRLSPLVSGTIAACVAAYLAATISRVHDVGPARAALDVAEAIAREAR